LELGDEPCLQRKWNGPEHDAAEDEEYQQRQLSLHARIQRPLEQTFPEGLVAVVVTLAGAPEQQWKAELGLFGGDRVIRDARLEQNIAQDGSDLPFWPLEGLHCKHG